MEGRCAVETWAEFGPSGTACSLKVKAGVGTDVYLCSGNEEVSVFSCEERKITASNEYIVHFLVTQPHCKAAVYAGELVKI